MCVCVELYILYIHYIYVYIIYIYIIHTLYIYIYIIHTLYIYIIHTLYIYMYTQDARNHPQNHLNLFFLGVHKTLQNFTFADPYLREIIEVKSVLIGGDHGIMETWNLDWLSHHIGNGISSSQLTKSIIFQRGRAKNHQPVALKNWIHHDSSYWILFVNLILLNLVRLFTWSFQENVATPTKTRN